MLDRIREIVASMQKEADKLWKQGQRREAALLASYSDQLLEALKSLDGDE